MTGKWRGLTKKSLRGSLKIDTKWDLKKKEPNRQLRLSLDIIEFFSSLIARDWQWMYINDVNRFCHCILLFKNRRKHLFIYNFQFSSDYEKRFMTAQIVGSNYTESFILLNITNCLVFLICSTMVSITNVSWKAKVNFIALACGRVVLVGGGELNRGENGTNSQWTTKKWMSTGNHVGIVGGNVL